LANLMARFEETNERTTAMLLLEGDLLQFLDNNAPGLVSDYFSHAYTGNQFHRLGGGGDVGTAANIISPTDLVAVSLLDVTVPGKAALDILGPLGQRVTELLTDIPTSVALEDSDESLIASGSPADVLWHELQSLEGMGPTIVSKVMARKRPRLIPIFDSVLKEALLPTEKSYWSRMRNELRQSEISSRLREIRSESGVGPEIPLLRILDVCVWMRNRPKSTTKLDFKPRSP
jgi:hypothetical protein